MFIYLVIVYQEYDKYLKKFQFRKECEKYEKYKKVLIKFYEFIIKLGIYYILKCDSCLEII